MAQLSYTLIDEIYEALVSGSSFNLQYDKNDVRHAAQIAVNNAGLTREDLQDIYYYPEAFIDELYESMQSFGTGWSGADVVDILTYTFDNFFEGH
jgi:hypothetical protein